jgi:hypothetical protein
MSWNLTAPAELDLSESQQPQLYAAYCSTFALAVIAVILRVRCRTAGSRSVGLWWDDYTILASLVRNIHIPELATLIAS